MAINHKKDPFTIKIKYYDSTGEQIVSIDLSRPEFEKQVLAAAGRFRSLKRQRKVGGKPPKAVICEGCKEEFESMAAFRRHECNPPPLD